MRSILLARSRPGFQHVHSSRLGCRSKQSKQKTAWTCSTTIFTSLWSPLTGRPHTAQVAWSLCVNAAVAPFVMAGRSIARPGAGRQEPGPHEPKCAQLVPLGTWQNFCRTALETE